MGFAELQSSVTCPQPFLWSASRIQICISKQINIPYIYSPSHALPETWVYLGNYENVRAPTLLTLLGLRKPDLFQTLTSHTMLVRPLQICYNICTKTKSEHLQQSLSCSGLLFSDLVLGKHPWQPFPLTAHTLLKQAENSRKIPTLLHLCSESK